MMNHVVLLEGLVPGEIFAAIVLILLGLLGLWQGWVTYTETTPHFVINYHGWACPPLAMFYGGAAMMLMSLPAFKLPLPKIALGVIGLAWIFCGITFLIGFFFWFPAFLVPRWYHRAIKAGVERNSPNTMGAFKALPLEQQRKAFRQGREQFTDNTSESENFEKKYTSQIRTVAPKIKGTAGRAFFVLGVGLTYNDEYQKADKRYREQNPELTSSERKERVAESATVRTGSQVLAAAGTGAAIGSVLPVGGTAVGLAVGTVVGLGTMTPTGDGKSVGDRIADVGEGFWNFHKGVFGG